MEEGLKIRKKLSRISMNGNGEAIGKWERDGGLGVGLYIFTLW